MKRRSFLHIALELLVLLGFLVLGVTILTFSFQKVPFDRIFVGILVSATGMLELIDFITWKYATKMRSLQMFVSAILSVVLGLLIIFIKMETNVFCYIWGGFSIAFALVKIATGTVNLAYQPLVNSVRIILSIIEIVFAILLMVRTDKAINSHILYLGIAFIVEAVTLFIEFMIHRYQRI